MSRHGSPQLAAMSLASVPLPDAAGPSMAMNHARRPSAKRAPRPCISTRNSGKLVAIMAVSSTVTGRSARKPERKERHGDAVIEVGRDRAAAAHTR